MTLPFNLFQPFTDRTFGSANPLDTRSPNNSHFSKPLPPIKVTAKRPSWRDITSGKVDQARAAVGARTAPTPQEIAEQLRAKAREAYAQTGALGRAAVRTAAKADIFGAGFSAGVFDPTALDGVGQAVQQYSALTDDQLTTSEIGWTAVPGVLAGATAGFIGGSRAFTGGIRMAGEAIGAERAAYQGARLAVGARRAPLTGASAMESLRAAVAEEMLPAGGEAATAVARVRDLKNTTRAADIARRVGETADVARYTGRGARAANVAETIERMREGTFTQRVAADLLPAVPVNAAQGVMLGKEGGEVTAMGLDLIGAKRQAAWVREHKGPLAGVLENEGMDMVGATVLQGLAAAVRANLTSTRELVGTAAGAGIGAYTDDENRWRGAGVGGALALAGSRGAEAVGLSTRIVNGIDVGVVAPFKAYSKGLLAVAESKQAKGDAGFWRATLLKGTRKAELDDTGMLQWLDQQSGTLTREQVAAEMRTRMPVLGAEDRGMTGEAAELYARESALIAKYHKLAERRASETNPTAQRSLRAQMRDVEEERFAIERALKSGGHKEPVHDSYVIPGQNDNYGELVTTKPPTSYTDPVFQINTHWPGTENPIAHSRVSERIVDGERALVVHDIQSDAHQIARDQGGYRDDAYRAAVAEGKARVAAVQAERDKLVQEWQDHEWKVKTEFDTESIRSATDASRNALRDEWRARINAKVAELAEREPALARVPISAQENFARSVLEDADPSFKALGDRLVNHPTGNDAVQTAVWEEVGRRMPDFPERERVLQQAARDAEKLIPAPRRVPDLPFKKTAQWTELQLKRVIEEAQQRGIDRVILPTGEQANKMFSLSQAADEMTFRPESGMFEARKGGHVVHSMQVEDASDLHRVIGRELTEKLMAAPQATGSPIPMNVLRGEDLEVGGAGMKAYYGGIVPPTIKDYAKKLGVKIEVERIGDKADTYVSQLTGELEDATAAKDAAKAALDEFHGQAAAKHKAAIRDRVAFIKSMQADGVTRPGLRSAEQDAELDRLNAIVDAARDERYDYENGTLFREPPAELTTPYREALERVNSATAKLKELKRNRGNLDDNLSFRITPEMKAAIKDGQPLWALGALSLTGDDRDGKSKLGQFAALALGATARGVKASLVAREIGKLFDVSPLMARALSQLDEETGYAPIGYAAARSMRESILAVGNDPKKLVELATQYRQLALDVRRGASRGDRTAQFTAQYAERVARGIKVLARELKRPTQPKVQGVRTVTEAMERGAAERVAQYPDLARIATHGSQEEKVAAVVAYFAPLLQRAKDAAIAEHGTASKWYDKSVADAQAIATIMVPELAEPHTYAFFNFVSSALSNGNPVSPEFRAATVVFDQFIRTGKLSIFHLDEAGRPTTHIPLLTEKDGRDALNIRPLMAISHDGDVARGGPRYNSWQDSLNGLQEVIDAHGGDLKSALKEIMGRGFSPSGEKRVRALMARGASFDQAVREASAGKGPSIWVKPGAEEQLRATQLLGPKLGQYGTDRTTAMRPGLGIPMAPEIVPKATNDMWVARGYNLALGQAPKKLAKKKFKLPGGGTEVRSVEVIDDGVSGPMHSVLNEAQRQLGAAHGLEPRDVQALLWEELKRESDRLGGGLEEGAFDTLATAASKWITAPPAPRLVGEVEGLARRAAAEQFIAARNATKHPLFLAPLKPEDLYDSSIHLAHEGKVGYALDPDGDLKNLFNNGGPRGAGAVAAMDAIANGATTLDAYDGHLAWLYHQLGFVETGRMKFNDEFAPAGWQEDEYLSTRPDVVFMAWHGFGGESADEVLARATDKQQWRTYAPSTEYFDDWDAAKRAALDSHRGSAERAASGRASARAFVDDSRNAGRINADGSLQPLARRRAGAASPGAVGALGGGAAGGAAGALLGAQADAAMGQDVSTREGAVAGLLGGLVAGAGGGGVMLHRLPGLLAGRNTTTLLSRSADVAQVVQSIAHGARTLSAPPSIFGDRVGQMARRAYAALVDDVYALRRLGRQVAGDAPLSGLDAQLRQSQRWITWADQRLQTQLRPVLDAARGREQDVMALVKIRRDMDLRAQGVAVKTDIADDVLARARAELEQDQRTVAAADALQDYYRGLLDWKLDERLHTQESYDAIVASEDFYTPFLREWEQEGLKGDGAGGFVGGGKTYNRGNGTRKLDRQQMARAKTIDPFEIAVMDTQKTAQLVGKQRVMQMISGMVEANGGEIPGVLKRVPKSDSPDPLGRRFDAIVNGQQVTYEVLDPDVFKAIQSFGPKTQVPAILKAIKEFKRAAITTLPDFALRNLIRDNAQVAVGNPVSWRGVAGGAAAGAGLGVASAANEPGDMEWNTAALRALAGAGVGTGGAVLVPQLARTMRGVTHIMAASQSPLAGLIGRTTGGNAAMWTQFLTDGGASIGHYARDLRDARNVLQTLRGDRARVYNPRRWYEAMEALGSTLENAPRLATYETALGGGATRPEAAALAADISLDFSRKGGSPFQQGLNETNAFLNARVQGWDKMARMLRDPRTWGVGFATLTAPSLGNWLAIHQDEQSRESYYEHPTWVRNTFWLVPTGGGDFLYIPKPFELGTVFSSIPERLLDWAYAKRTKADVRPGESAGHTAAELLSSVVATEIPITDALKPVLEQSINYDFFRNRPIVSSETYTSSKTLPEFQTDDRTSKVARIAGERFGWSPQRVDHLIGAYGGSAGKVALRALDEILPGENTSPTAGRMPIVGDLVAGFTDRKGQTSDAEVTVRRRYDHLQRVENALKPLLKMAEDESADPARREAARKRALVLVEQNAKDIGAEGEHLDGLKAANDVISELRDEARAIQRTPGMPAAERKAQLEDLQRARAQVARLAVAGRYDEIEALVAQWKGVPQ